MRVFVMMLLVACRISLDDGAPADATGGDSTCAQAQPSLAWIEPHIFRGCSVSTSCHGGTAHQADDLVLSAGVARDNLVGKSSREAPAWTLVTPGDAEHSYLMVAVGAIAGPLPKDGVMPLIAAPLCAEKLDALQAWIAAGADR